MQGHAACQLTDLEAGHFRQFLQRPQLRAGHAALPLDPLRMTLGGADQYPKSLQDRKGRHLAGARLSHFFAAVGRHLYAPNWIGQNIL